MKRISPTWWGIFPKHVFSAIERCYFSTLIIVFSFNIKLPSSFDTPFNRM